MRTMQKFWLIAALLGGWSLLCPSCAKQEAEEPEQVIGGDSEESGDDSPMPKPRTGMTVSVGIVPQESSKVEVTAAGKVTWSVGDHIAIFVGGVAKDFELISGAGSENAVFYCEDVPKGTTLDGVAIYPYKSDLTYNTATGAVKVYIPAEQSADVSSAPMLASVSSTGDRFFFHNLGGIFEFTYTNVPPEAKYLKFTSSTYNINGVFTLSSSSETLSTETETDSGNTKVTTVSLPAARPDGTATVQVPVPVGEYQNFTIALCTSDGTVIQNLTGMPNTQKSGSKITAKANVLSPIKAINLPEGVKIQWIWDNDGTLGTFTGNVPAIDEQGNVYVQTGYDCKIFKLNRDGQKLWEFPLTGVTGRCNTSPSLELDASVVYALGSWTTGQGKIYAINASDGSKKWECTDYPAFVNPTFDKAMTAVGTGNNIYVPANWNSGVNSTVLSIRKSDGHCVCYSSSNESGSAASLRTSPGGIAISSVGLVCYQTNDGAAFMRQDKMDSPTTSHATHGPYVWYAYRDLWPVGWGGFFNSTQGVVCGRKGPTSGKNVVVSCAQETIKNESDVDTGSRMDVYCSSADEAVSLTGYRQEDVAYNNANWHAYWRFQYGWHTTAGRPGYQDQGGMILGHDDLEVLLPLKANFASTGKDDKTRSVGPAGVVSIWMDRSASKPSTRDATSCWRFNISTPANADASTHSIEGYAEVSGSPAVDNNGWVHVGSREYYHIFAAATGDPYTITYQSRVNWADLLNASGHFSKTVTRANPWTSVKIGYDGRIYFNLSLTFADNSTGGAVLCLTYPGVKGPDATSSWPQKGADPYNSCRQVEDASGNWHSNSISWD